MTITATPSSAASGSSSRSHSRSCGLYGTCTVSKRPVRSARRELAERAGRSSASRRAGRSVPASRSGSSQSSMLAPRDEVVHLLDLDAAEPVELPPVLLASLLDAGGPDLRRDRGSLAPSRERRAERGLGAAVHRRRVEDVGSLRRAPRRRRSAASVASPPNVFQVPSPTTGPSRRSSISRSGSQRARPAAKAAAKNERIVVRPAAHVRERQARAQLLPSRSRRRRSAARATAGRRSRPATERRRHRGRARAPPVCGGRRRGDARARRSRMRAPRGSGEPCSATPCSRRRRQPTPPWPSAVPVPTMPGPIAHTTTSKPSAAAQSERRRCRDALDVAVEAGADRDRRARRVPALAQEPRACRTARPAARRPRAARTRRGRPCRCPRTPARPGCGGSSRRRACPASVVGSVRPSSRVPDRATGPACTEASSRARRRPPEGRGRASGSRTARRSRRIRARARAPAC